MFCGVKWDLMVSLKSSTQLKLMKRNKRKMIVLS